MHISFCSKVLLRIDYFIYLLIFIEESLKHFFVLCTAVLVPYGMANIANRDKFLYRITVPAVYFSHWDPYIANP